MLKLYYAPQTRAFRPRWLLEELGVPFELIKIDLSSPPPGYFKIHPHGWVPALEDLEEGLLLIESGAICTYLADRFLEKQLAPKLRSVERGLYFGWIFYATATLEPAIENGLTHFDACAEFLQTDLNQRPFLLKSGFSAADVLVGSLLAWAKSKDLIEGFPGLQAYLGRLRERPAYQKARKD